MSSAPASPKRRHVLSSINPENSPKRSRRNDRNRESPTNDSAPSGGQDHHDENRTDATKPRGSRLKLKGERSKHRSRDDHSRDSSRRRHHRHRRRRHRSPTPPNPHDTPQLDPDVAFRESLFDAMADDEGASYWESVYGQPVHVYSSEKVGPSGELEQMTEEEYATYVRRKMWEKTHAGLLEERERREKERKKKKDEERQNRKLHEDMERSLRRGEERRRRRRWVDGWEAYTQAWAAWDGTLESMSWPMEGGQRKDINEKDVRDFFIFGLDLENIGEKEFAARLKDERVRWHPDKIQQKLGGQVDGEVIKDVTAVFQIVDMLWNDMRSEKPLR
ncbi:hypothetical protein PT974_10557 [Cladobotryum mycophilum]|uniref:J domain-containing protein n=1 Tax=Cladobotryum mycophilum TaxID=491253 RepID=A0ABR0SAP5_9HYPO